MGITPYLLEIQVRGPRRSGTADRGSPLKMGGKTSPPEPPSGSWRNTQTPLSPLQQGERVTGVFLDFGFCFFFVTVTFWLFLPEKKKTGAS